MERRNDTCARCAHESAAHAHNREGTDCALCDCARYRRLRLPWRRRSTGGAGVQRPAPTADHRPADHRQLTGS